MRNFRRDHYPKELVISPSTRGVFVIAATPFDERGALDLASVPSLVDYYLGHGVHGITLLGMMGEANKLTQEESSRLVGAVMQAIGGRVPVVVGVSHSSLTAMRELAHESMMAGAAGVMIAPPTGLRTDDQQFSWFGDCCAALGPDVPVIYQDYPPTTGVFLSASLYLRIAAAQGQVAMLKMEDHPGLDKITRIRAAEARGEVRRTAIVVGNGGLLLPQGLQRGAEGVMTGFGYPEMLVQVYHRHAAGDVDGAEDIYDRYLPLVTYEQQPGYGLAVRKEILRRRGAIRTATVRAPGPRLSAADVAELDRVLARLAVRLSGGADG
jgi:4-hydroxy-tetrahydrodipicolinate synthase